MALLFGRVMANTDAPYHGAPQVIRLGVSMRSPRHLLL